jgi:hypothetical protein
VKAKIYRISRLPKSCISLKIFVHWGYRISMRIPIRRRNAKSTWGLSQIHLSLLGAISAASAMLEQSLGTTLRGQLGLDAPLSNILVSGMNLNTLTENVIKLARFQLPDTSVLEDLEAWIPRVRSAAKKRNLAIHSSWISNPAPGTLESTSFAKAAVRGTFTSTTWTETELEELVAELGNLTGELSSFWWRMGLIAGEPPESPKSKK